MIGVYKLEMKMTAGNGKLKDWSRLTQRSKRGG
jgi:predicted ATP-dependent Lon-type protease